MKRSIVISLLIVVALTSCVPISPTSPRALIPLEDTIPENLTIQLSDFSIFLDDDIAGSDEPYLWVYFIVVDWDTIASGEYVQAIDPRGHGNITSEGMDGGDSIPIPESVGYYQKQLNAVPLLDLSLVGFLVMGWEEDETPNSNILEAYDSTRQILNDFINEQVEDLNFNGPDASAMAQLQDEIYQEVYEIIGDAVYLSDPDSWNYDDFIGADVRLYTIQVGNLMDEHFQLTLTLNPPGALDPRDAVADYRVDGQLSTCSSWDAVSRYSTIRNAVVRNEPFLMARANAGIAIWRNDTENNSWSSLPNGPEWSDANGWADVTNYSTIQTAVVNNELYLLGRTDDAIALFKFDPVNELWTRLPNGPEWSDASGWADVTNYSTIQTAVVNTELYLLARADAGIAIWKYDTENNSWYSF